MFNFIKKFFDYNEKELGRLQSKVAEINALEDKARGLKDADFKKETDRLRHEVQLGNKTTDDILPWAYALVREASRRILGQRHFDVQLIAGIALHEGKVAEQKTGEGKTLSATSALYLNSFVGHGVHLVTVNDYLARRDAGWMGALYHFLGLKTSAIISEHSFLYDPEYVDKSALDSRLSHLKPISRKEAYQADVTYGINSEFGFDYLRDNMAQSWSEVVQRGFHFAVIDEADSVLIDEARTPHIISAPYDEDTTKYYQYAQLTKLLDPKTDYVIDEKLRTANLTEAGIQKIEHSLGVANIYEKDFDTLFHLEAALKAETLFKIDKDYIVKEGEVIIVDEFTGRLLQGRRFSEGLHQAIEAKERVSIQKESKTLATVSLQNYFRMYKKLAGMTGTAATEAEELHKIYNVNVLVVPTHMPMVRRDEPDMIYKTEKAKYNAVVEEIIVNYKVGRPVLVGTTSIEKNELLSKSLKQKGVPHELLNAKNHEKEAGIIARAGERGAITVATNMAGRGVDIILGGTPPDVSDFKTDILYKKALKEWQKKHDEVISLGGLYVLGTERHESRRIDNQLRGRSGRQGDPGATRFFVALEDDLMRIFGGEQISKLMTFFNFPEDQPLTHSMVSKAIEQAQVKVEGFNFDIRKHLVDFDDVLNKQRDIIYSLRRKILELPEKEAKSYRQTIIDTFQEEFNVLVNSRLALSDVVSDEDITTLIKELQFVMPVDVKTVRSHLTSRDAEGMLTYLSKTFDKEYAKHEKEVGRDLWMQISRVVYLTTIDKFWMEHLTSIEELREGINLRGYAQLDPLVEYKNEAYSMFEKLVGSINFEFTRRLLKVEVGKAEPTAQLPQPKQPVILKSASRINPFQAQQSQQSQVQPSQPVQSITSAQPSPETSQPNMTIQGFKVIPPGTSHRKLGRNDPCWCGSGKKYKRCHYPN